MSAKVDGLLIAEGIDVEHMARLASRLPVAVVSGSPDERYADVVHADNRAGASALVRHLIELHGRSRLFFVAGRARRRTPANGARPSMRSLPGIRTCGWRDPSRAGSSAASGQLAMRELLAAPRSEMPDAIVCANDQMAIGAMRELQAAGIRVPRQTSP